MQNDPEHNFLLRLLGFRKSSTFGSNQRRLMARLTFVAAIYMFCSVFLNVPLASSVIFVAVPWTFFFFVVTVGWIIYLTSAHYPPDPLRLIYDILVSGFFGICSFALAYEVTGIVDTLDRSYLPVKSDYLYFSTVTFSTLGFGDFRPTPAGRLLASSQAILGNLHLGMLAGATFYALQRKTENRKQKDETKP